MSHASGPARATAVAISFLLVFSLACRPGTPEEKERRGGGSPTGGGTDPSLGLVLEDPHGRTIRLADYEGKVRVIDVWATWCAPCREIIPQLNTLYGRYRDRGLVVIGVSVDSSPGDILEFQREVPIRYPSGMFNPDLTSLIGEPSAIPTTFLLDRSGVIRETFVGYVDEATLEQQIRELL